MEFVELVWHTCTVLLFRVPQQRSTFRPSGAFVWGLFSSAACCAMMLGLGFTVDDALISTRVAHHLRVFAVHAFNAHGPAVDCVTPLGWAWLLAPFSEGGPWSGLVAARWLGALCALGSAAVLGKLVHESAPEVKHVTIKTALVASVLGTNLPLGAWATSGMETSVAMLLCTVATLGFTRDSWLGPGCAGVVSALRPELLPWALALGLCAPLRTSPGSRLAPAQRQALSRLARIAVILIPTLLAISIRLVVFGSPVPLAVLAKPSDAGHGWFYVWGALRLLGCPVLLLGWRAWKRLPSIGLAVAASLAAHVISVAGVGGDWMSLFRLFIPLVPSCLWLGFLVLCRQGLTLGLLKGSVALAINIILLSSLGESSRQIVSARRELVSTGAPIFESRNHVAALDVGWLGAATNKPITDLAGVTDPEIARLAGGHTSKRLPRNLLERRGIDTLVVLLAPNHPTVTVGAEPSSLHPARAVESSLLRLDAADQFRVTATIPLKGTTQSYVILER